MDHSPKDMFRHRLKSLDNEVMSDPTVPVRHQLIETTERTRLVTVTTDQLESNSVSSSDKRITGHTHERPLVPLDRVDDDVNKRIGKDTDHPTLYP